MTNPTDDLVQRARAAVKDDECLHDSVCDTHRTCLGLYVLALADEVERLRRFHAPTCNAILDDDSDMVLGDFQTCTCGVKP